VSISSTFYAQLLQQYFCAKKLQSQNVTKEKLREALSYEKFAHKMFVKLTPGGILPNVISLLRQNFSNFLALKLGRCKKAKYFSSLQMLNLSSENWITSPS